ncbi:MAG: hypothetical protein QNJ97_29350 [Myxococcota bacterium]|nr:hypothetical protein [Myxococcota bacterium]
MNIGLVSYRNRRHISADHGVVPDACLFPQGDIPQNNCPRGNKTAWIYHEWPSGAGTEQSHAPKLQRADHLGEQVCIRDYREQTEGLSSEESAQPAADVLEPRAMLYR